MIDKLFYDKLNSTLYNAITVQSKLSSVSEGENPVPRLNKFPFLRNMATAFQRLIARVKLGT